jgi:hypothetical protein
VEKKIDCIVSLRFCISHENGPLMGKAYLNDDARILIETARGCLLQMLEEGKS